jgi:hypothetical protein
MHALRERCINMVPFDEEEDWEDNDFEDEEWGDEDEEEG